MKQALPLPLFSTSEPPHFPLLHLLHPRQYTNLVLLSLALGLVAGWLAVAFLATVLTASLAPGLSSRMEQYQQQAPSSAAAAGNNGQGNSGTGNAATGNNNAPELCNLPNSNIPLPSNVASDITTFCQQYIHGFERAYQWTFYAALLALLLGAFLPGWPLRWEGRENIQESGQPSMAAGHD